MSDDIKKRDYDMKMSSPFYNKNNSIFSTDNERNLDGMEGMPDFFKNVFGGSGPIDLASMAGMAGP